MPSRNDPCPCGSGKKYKRCCMARESQQSAEIFNDIEQAVAMNPNLSIDELNALAQHKANKLNSRPVGDFCGLSPAQMNNWLYAPFSELQGVTISPPDDLSSSPVMRYLQLILDEAMQQQGAFKVTSRGNLPTKLVKQASELLPEFHVAKYNTAVSISAYAGANEGKFEALHYSRALADIAGIVYLRSGRMHVKKSAQKQYQAHGLKPFFLPMLEAAVISFNWGYFDAYEEDLDLRPLWLFMLWRLQFHGSVERLVDEVVTAFPHLLHQVSVNDYTSPDNYLGHVVESRFIHRFLEFWGLVTLDPKQFFGDEAVARNVDVQPLLKQAFQFSV